MNTATQTVVAALRAEADRQIRAGTRLSAEVMHDRATTGRDIRSSAVKIVEVIGTGQALNEVATGLESGTLLLVSADTASLTAAEPDGADDEPPTPPDDDPDGGDDDERRVTTAQVVDIFSQIEREEASNAGS